MKSLLAWAVLLTVVGFVPLFGGPRYEAALFAGLVGPFWCSLAVATDVLRFLRSPGIADDAVDECTGGAVLVRIVSGGFGHVLVLLAVAVLHGVRVGFCEPLLGFGLLALGPGFGLLLAAGWGGLCALLWYRVVPPGSRLVSALTMCSAISAPLVCIIWGLFHFYDSPSVYAYSPFVGYFAGPLYDTVVYDLERLSGYRMGTLLTLLALGAALLSVRIRRGSVERERVGFLTQTPQRVVLVLAGVAAAAGSLAHASFSEEMGYSSSTEGIRRALGRALTRERCRVFFSRAVPQADAVLVAEECVGHLVQIEEYFGIQGYPGVDVFLFANSGEKRRLMGAATTYIAKPWRREIYIQPGGFPHQVLGHELAHAVTGFFGEGPFRIAGHLGGLVPDPGRIEGFAEAASPKEHSEGTLHEWTAAMKQLELLPPIESLFRLSFLGASPANAYAASGSFVDFVRRGHGPDALQKWYEGGDLEVISGSTWQQLEKDWHRFLSEVTIPTAVLEIARPRFSRPAVFERRCPHAVDRLISKSVELCPYQEAKAVRLATEAVQLDPMKKDLELRSLRCGWYAGDAQRSKDALLQGASLENEFEPGARRAAFEFAGNIAWSLGQKKDALDAFRRAQELTFDLDQKRSLEVKLWALEQEGAVQVALRELLAPGPRETKIPAVFLTEWLHAGPEKELARYLLIRTLENSGAWEDGDMRAVDLAPEKLPLRSLKLEALRMKVMSGCRHALRTRKGEVLRSAVKEYIAAQPHSAGVLEATRVQERCEAALGMAKGVQ